MDVPTNLAAGQECDRWLRLTFRSKVVKYTKKNTQVLPLDLYLASYSHLWLCSQILLIRSRAYLV